jgi:predicted site-specific integrase-resolvase
MSSVDKTLPPQQPQGAGAAPQCRRSHRLVPCTPAAPASGAAPGSGGRATADLGLSWRQPHAPRTTIGYARVSTTDQDLDIQVTALKREGCTTIRSEKRSGTTTRGREELRTVLDFLRAGDVLMVTRIDRLAKSIGDLQDIVRTVRVKGASLKATEQPIDTSTAAGKCFLDMLGVFAEFETNLRRERQLEGIAKAKAAGVY